MLSEATIVAQVPTYIGVASDGTRTLDVAGLTAWVKAQVNIDVTTSFVGVTIMPVIGGAQITKAEAILQSVTRIMTAIQPFIDNLAAVIAPAHWAKRADWPTPTKAPVLSTVIGGLVSSVNDASRRITAQYDALNDALTNRIRNDVFNVEVAPFLPEITSRVVEDRYYTTTLVTTWGEESAPSPASVRLEADQNDIATINRPTSIYPERLVNRWRIYRTNTGNQSDTVQFVAEVPITTATYVDAKRSSELGETIATTGWLPPPDNLAGLTALSNGILAGFFDNTVCFCVPYKPYAWPIAFQLSTKLPIVGLGGFGSTLFVGTRGSPYLATGTDSASMDLQELPSNQACVSARSIVSVDNGVIYASPDGLCLATVGGVQVITDGLVTKQDWAGLVPSSIIAALHDQTYYFVYNTGLSSGVYALDFVTKKLVQFAGTATALYTDQVTDTLYAISGTSILAIFAGATKRMGTYRTGIIKLELPAPMGWLQVDSTFAAPVTVKWYGDGVLRYTVEVNSTQPVRLPAGRYLEHEIEITSQADVTKVTLASTTQELQSV